MSRVLVLGAGMVARPLVRYLLDQSYDVTVATRTVSKAEALIGDDPHGTALPLMMDDLAGLGALVEAADVVLSLVPPPFHPQVAEICLQKRKHLITTSYLSPAMRAFDERAREAGLLFLNEIGLDPGIDHMSAMRVIDDVHGRGGKIVGFHSCCGALPAPEAADNPWCYKFSWSPIGVIRAIHNSGKFLRDGEVVDVPAAGLFRYVQHTEVEGVGRLEIYTNRDCLDYVDLYGIPEVKDMFRGTFRFESHCAAWDKLVQLGVFDEEVQRDLAGKTLAQVLAEVADVPVDSLESALEERFGVANDDPFMERLRYARMFSEDPCPLESGSICDVMVHQLEKLLFLGEQERDMVVLRDEFVAEFPNGTRERHVSQLVDFGIPGGDSATARTVSLPAAVATKMVIDGAIDVTGVFAPTDARIYDPVLDGLEELGIECVETREVL